MLAAHSALSLRWQRLTLSFFCHAFVSACAEKQRAKHTKELYSPRNSACNYLHANIHMYVNICHYLALTSLLFLTPWDVCRRWSGRGKDFMGQSIGIG